MPITNHPIVGRVRWRSNPDGTIEILDGWAAENITTVEIRELRGIPTFGGSFGGRVQFYKGAADQLQAAWREVGERRLLDRVLFWSGSFVPRLQRGSATKPSNHTFGTAFDINHQQNGLGITPPPAGVRGSVRELVPIFEKYGFLWGGNFRRRKDGMHFEIERLGLPREVTAPTSVEIFINERQAIVPALLLENHTWVGVRDLMRHLGGEIVRVQAKPFVVTVKIRDSTREISGENIGGIGYVPFRQLNELYKVPFQFDNTDHQLRISKLG